MKKLTILAITAALTSTSVFADTGRVHGDSQYCYSNQEQAIDAAKSNAEYLAGEACKSIGQYLDEFYPNYSAVDPNCPFKGDYKAKVTAEYTCS